VVEVRAGLGVVTIGILGGEMLAGMWQPPRALLVAVPLVVFLCHRRAAVWTAVGVAALAVGVGRMGHVIEPRFPPDHAAELRLPLRTTLTGRVAAPPERRRGRTVVLLAAERAGAQSVSGLVRVTIRHARRRWRYGDRLRVETTLRRPRNFEFRRMQPETLSDTLSRRTSATLTPALSAVEWGGVPEFGSSVVAGRGADASDRDHRGLRSSSGRFSPTSAC
jgi:Domain of unknown function (DUF4131)